MKVLVVTGKGGTGKTTVAAAAAAQSAALGLRTLVLSTDSAHSLADAFACPIGPRTVEIAPDLWAQEIDTQRILDSTWSVARNYLQEVIEWAGASSSLSSDLSVIPGLEEVLALREIGTQLREAWDAVVIDCAPTAETVRLLALPTAVQDYITQTLPTHRRIAKSVSGIARRSGSLPPKTPAGLADVLLELADELVDVQRQLTDSATTSTCLVTTPERMAVNETRRAQSFLSLYGHHVDTVVVNRLLPDSADGSWAQTVRDGQALIVAELDEMFTDLQTFVGPAQPCGVYGLPELRRFGSAVFGEHLLVQPPENLITMNQSTNPNALRLHLPGMTKDRMRLSRSDDNLNLTLDSFRRVIAIPAHLRSKSVHSATVCGDDLVIEFV